MISDKIGLWYWVLLVDDVWLPTEVAPRPTGQSELRCPRCPLSEILKEHNLRQQMKEKTEKESISLIWTIFQEI